MPRSLRSRVLLGSILWTLGLIAVSHIVSAVLYFRVPQMLLIAHSTMLLIFAIALPDRRSVAGSRRAVDTRSVALCTGRRPRRHGAPGRWHLSRRGAAAVQASKTMAQGLRMR